MVPTEVECIHASMQLNTTYKWRMSRTSRPAGCFKESKEGVFYFNLMINPTNTNPTQYHHLLTAEGIKKFVPICIKDGN